MTNSTQDLHFSTNFQRSVNPALRESVQDFDLFSGGRYLRAFDYIEEIDQSSHHILVYLGSRMPYDQGTFVGIQVWPSIATISQSTKMDSSTVRRKVHKLAEMGYITAKRNKRMNNAGKWEQGSNTYALTEKAFLQYAIATQQKTLANVEISLSERAALEQKIFALKEKLAAFELDRHDAGNPLAESDRVQDLNPAVIERQGGVYLHSASDSSSHGEAITLQPARTPAPQGNLATGREPGGVLALAGAAPAEWKANSPFKSTLNSPAKSSSRLQARTYDALDRQLIVEEEVDVGRFNNAIADLSRRYATYFSTNPSRGDLDRFCSHFLDLCPNELGADERLMAKVYEDMKWVYDRPHLHRSVRSINFVWHMAKMREKDEAYARRISYFVRSMVSEGKSVEEALHSCAKAMNLNSARFAEWAKAHLSLQV